MAEIKENLKYLKKNRNRTIINIKSCPVGAATVPL
jgi:hypothetical protein